MQRRDSYSDLGLMVAIGIFICLLIKSLMFGFTWVSIVWLLLACVYFYVSWRYASRSRVVRHSTTVFLLLSVVAIMGILLFDRNTRPVMHAFAGTGDTIADPIVMDEVPVLPIADIVPVDTLEADTLAADSVSADTIINNVSSLEVLSADSVGINASDLSM